MTVRPLTHAATRCAALVATAVVVLAALLLASGARAAPVAPLSHVGRWITDAQGRVVILHGINMTSKLPPYEPETIGFGRSDAVFLRHNAMTTVRLGIIWKALEPTPGHYDDTYLGSIIRTIRLLEQQGIWVLVDFHQDQYNEKYNGEGFPDWADLDDGQPTTPNLGFPRNYTNMPALNRAFDSFWANRAASDGVGLQDHFAMAWRHVARALRGEPRLLGFDVLNEPWPGSVWPSCQQASGCPQLDAQVTAFTNKVITYIRSVDRRRLVFYEPILPFSTTGRPHIGAISDPNTVFGFHDYCLAGGITTVRCTPNDRRVFSRSEQLSQRTGDGLFLSEFGATQSADDMTRVENAADAALVGWQNWAYWNEDTCCRRPGEGLLREIGQFPAATNVKPLKLLALARPYPQTIAGTPTLIQFVGSSRTLTASWSTTSPRGHAFRAGSITEVQVPRVQYPHGYAVEVSGARVTSVRNAPVLTLTSRSGATEVVLTLRPAARKGKAGKPQRSGTSVGTGGTGGASSSAHRSRRG